MNLDALLSPPGTVTNQFEGFLGELWTVWSNDVGRAVLLARWLWQKIPESVIQQAAAIDQQTQAAQSSRAIGQQVNMQLGALGISPSTTGRTFLGGIMDPNVAMFLKVMGMVRAYKGDPPMETTSPKAALAEAVLRGHRDPVEVMMEAAPPAAKQQLNQVVQLAQMSGFYSIIQLEASVLAAFALPRNRIPLLLPEVAADKSTVLEIPDKGIVVEIIDAASGDGTHKPWIRPETEMKSWLETHRKELSQGNLSARDVVNAFLTGGTISQDRFQAALTTDSKLAKEVGLTKEAAYDVLEVPYAWYEQGDAAAAKPVLLAFTALAADAYCENMAGACDCRLESHEDALVHYERALAIDPEYSDAHINHARELFCLHRNIEALLELAKLATAQKTEGERTLARRARGELGADWARILELAKQKEDTVQATGAWEIYREVRPKVAAMGIELPEIVVSPAEKQAATESLLKLFKGLGGSAPDALIKKLEDEAGIKNEK